MNEVLLIGLIGLALAAFGLAGIGFAVFSWRAWQKSNQEYTNKQQDLNQQLQQLTTDLAVANSEVSSLETQLGNQSAQLNQANQELTNSKLEQGKLTAELKEKTNQFAAQQAELKQEFSRLANEIFDKKSKDFDEQSAKNLTHLLAPFQHDVKSFKDQVEKIQQTEMEQRIALKTELQNLQNFNKNLSDQAQQLTEALQGQKKTQGNWGEMILERVLESAGFQAPRDFMREQSFKVEEGRLRPDAVVYLPGEKHLVIDAKTSLNAYTKFVNSQDEDDRQQALKEHVAALRDRMKELSAKDYFRLPGLVAPEVVVLFVPIESAYVEALKADDKLLDDAMRMQLLIATPSTLLSSLQVIRQLWRFAEQNKHSQELASRAEKFYNKLHGFIGSLEAVGNQLDRAKDSYDKAYAQLYTGRGNLIKQVTDFKELGVLVTKELSEELLEKAALELVADQPLELTVSKAETSEDKD